MANASKKKKKARRRPIPDLDPIRTQDRDPKNLIHR